MYQSLLLQPHNCKQCHFCGEFYTGSYINIGWWNCSMVQILLSKLIEAELFVKVLQKVTLILTKDFAVINTGLNKPLSIIFDTSSFENKILSLVDSALSLSLSHALLWLSGMSKSTSVVCWTRCSTLYSLWWDNPDRSHPEHFHSFPPTPPCSPLQPGGVITCSFNVITSK